MGRLIKSLTLDRNNNIPYPFRPSAIVAGDSSIQECVATKILLAPEDAYLLLQDYLTPGAGLPGDFTNFKRRFPKLYFKVLGRECEKITDARNAKRVATYAEVLHTYRLIKGEPRDALPLDLVESLGLSIDD